MTLDAHVHLEAELRLRNGASTACDESGSMLGSILLDCARTLAAGGAGTAHLRFNPVRWAARGVPVERQLQDLGRVRDQARRDCRIELAFFVTLKRDGMPASWVSGVDVALAGRAGGIIGVDLSRSYDVASASPPSAPEPAGELFDQLRRARAGGLVVAMHCGWHDGRADLEAALSVGATRIGHGTPLRDAPDLEADFAARGAVVEVCPTAFERRSGESAAALPVDRWLDVGIGVVVGSDHPVAFGTSTRTEHDRLTRIFPRWGAASSVGRHG